MVGSQSAPLKGSLPYCRNPTQVRSETLTDDNSGHLTVPLCSSAHPHQRFRLRSHKKLRERNMTLVV